jgi:hypothetical protein
VILPAGLEPRAFLGADAISNSELSTLSRCEQAWVLGYTGEREKSTPSKAMQLGTEVHRLWGAWWMNGGLTGTEDPTAATLMDRYRRYNVGDRASGVMRCLATEVPVAARFSWGNWFFGFADGLFQVEGLGFEGVPDGLYVGEAKTAAQLSAVTYLVQSTQTPLYVWAFRQMGLPVLGSFVDVLRTTGNEPQVETKADCYKRLRRANVAAGIKETKAETEDRIDAERLTLGEPPLAESFDRRWLLEGPAGDLDIIGAIGQARRASGVRRQLLSGEPPLRNVGPSCSWCSHQAVCFGLDTEICDESDAPF